MSLVQQSFAMTRKQKGIWITELKYPGTNMFNIGGSCSVESKIEIPRLKLAIEKTIEEIQCLNLTVSEDNSPRLFLHFERQKEKVSFYDFSEQKHSEEAFQEWRQECLSQPMDLAQCLYYFAVYKVRPDYYGFLIKIHHIVCDGVTMENIISTICKNYNNSDHLDEVIYPPNDQQYFLQQEERYLSSCQYQRDKNFWQQTLISRGESSNFLLKNRSLSPQASRKIYDIPTYIEANVKQVCQTAGCSENLFYYAATTLMLSRFSGHRCVSFGVPLHGRNKSDLKRNSMTVSTVPVQIDVDESMNFMDLIKCVAAQNRQLYRHQKYDYTELVSINRENMSADTLFDISFNYANTHYALQLGDNPLIVEDIFPGELHYSMHLLFKSLTNEKVTRIYCDYKTGDYESDQIDVVIEFLIEILDDVSTEPSKPLYSVALPKQADICCIETGRLNLEPSAETIVSLFFASAQTNENRIAVIDRCQQISYSALVERVRNISQNLSILGISSGTRVAILLPKSIDQIATLLAVMALGATYVPLEKDLPQERIRYILNDSECKLVITTQNLMALLPSEITYCDIMALNELPDEPAGFIVDCQPDGAAYLIYTSGSTGLPKGTLIRHAELVNYCQWAAGYYYPEQSDIAALFTPLTFDLTVTSLFPPLIAGAAIKVYQESEHFILSDIIHDQVATVIKCTPSHLRAIQHEVVADGNTIRRFIVGGENLKTSVANHVVQQFGGKVDIFNEYGPTETVVGCMIHHFVPGSDTGISVPIGKPIDNTQIYIVDRCGRHCRPYMKGEIVIAGNCVSAGYWKRDEMTQQKFISDMFYPQQRAYLSGDLAYRNSEGNSVYIGRVDKQIKIRGHRIEIEEIEFQLLEHNSVQNAVVLVNDGESENAMIQAYVVLNPELPMDSVDLKDYLACRLVHYMVPQKVLFVDEIPLTFNGKVDSAQLFAMAAIEAESGYHEEKGTLLELSVLEEYQRVLGKDSFSLYSDFYQGGGDSIKAIQLVTLLQKKGFVVTGKDVLQFPTPQLLCYNIARRRMPEESEFFRPSIFEPTPIMQWFSDLKLERKEIYHQMLSISLPQTLNHETLVHIFNILIQAHPILNADVSDDNMSLQVRQQPWQGLQRMTVYNQEERIHVAEKLLSDSSWPESALFQAVLLDDGSHHELMLLAHHLIIDGVSWRILVADLNTLVEQYLQHQPMNLPHCNNHYQKWIEFTRYHAGEVSETEKLFWQKQINGSSLFENVDLSQTKQSLGLFDADIFKMTFVQFSQLCLQLKTKPNELLFALFTYALSQVYGEKELTVELEGIGRNSSHCNVDLSRSIGWFTSVYPLKSHCGNDIIQHLKQVKQNIRSVLDNGISWQSLHYFSENKLLQYSGRIPRFNYLGDFSHSNFHDPVSIQYVHPHVMSVTNNIYCDVMDFNIYWESECKVSVSYIEQLVSPLQLQQIVKAMENQLETLSKLTDMDTIDLYVTSDFPTISLTNNEIKKMITELSISSI